jgi:copper chaperone CopZ
MSRLLPALMLTMTLLAPVPASTSPPVGTTPKRVDNITLAVRGMFCGSCATAVKKALARLPGIIDVAVEVERDRVTVTYNPRKASVPQMVEAIRKAGYRAEAPPGR